MFGKYTSVLMALVLLAGTGCSTSRLRNLISRNDYQSLEEIEKTEQQVDDQRSADDSSNPDTVLVSESREAEAEDAEDESGEAEKSERGGLLNLASLFRRDKEEITPDPFVEGTDTDETAAADNRVTPISGESAEQIVQKAAEQAAENNSAEVLIREAVAEAEAAVAQADAEAGDAAGPVITPGSTTESSESTTQKSFADFIAEQQQKAAALAEDHAAAADNAIADAANPFGALTEQTADAVDGFDQLLADQTDELLQAEQTDGSELFPGIDELLAETAPVIDEEPSLDQFFSDNSDTTPAVDSDNPFAEVTTEEAAAQHGFTTEQPNVGNDPWAAFQRLQTSTADAPTDPTDSDEFAWAKEPAAAAEPQAVVTAAAASPTLPESPFRNVSASFEVDPVAPEFDQPNADPAALVIPSTTPAVDETELFTTPFDATEADPFADAEDAEVERTETTAGAPLPSGFQGRTWFLLLGLAIVALLLFLPERQNRTES